MGNASSTDFIENRYPFLEDSGECGELVRSFDWTKSTLGPIDTWPPSLVTPLSLVLHSGFPMVLFWGKDLICFYNDAFRPSLGVDGNHPAIGKRGEEVWHDRWPSAGPLILSVLETGKPVYVEDQLVGFYRNGKKEDIYWTFSYSPAYGDDGRVSGVLVVCAETTKSINTIKRLAESEERFKRLAEEADILIAMSDDSGKAVFFSKAWLKLTGRSEHELIDYGWADLIHDEDRDRFVNNYLQAFARRDPWSEEFRVRIPSGRYRWLMAKCGPRSLPGGAFNGYVSTCFDITDRKAAEERLRESEHRLRQIIESAPFPIGVYVGRDMRIALVNQSILDVWSKPRDVIGKTYAEVLPELESQSIYTQLDLVFTTGKPFHARNQRVDLAINGELKTFYFNYSFTPLFDMKGNVYGLMNTAADVTDVHLAKQRVEQSEQNLRNMVLQAPVAMAILRGPDHVIEVANDLIIDLWGKEKTTVMDKPVFEALPDARNQGLEDIIRDVFNTGISFHANERPVNLIRGGIPDTLYLNFVYEPYRDNDGTIVGVLAIAIDVTAQVLSRFKIEDIVAERTHELAEANQRLEKSNAELAQFAYIASHDLQEPLRKIRTYTGMLERKLSDAADESTSSYLNKIQVSSARMQALIRDVLTYSELEKRHEHGTVDLNSVLADIREDFELAIIQKNAIIHADRLPVVNGNALQLTQLFGNLISNSLKFSRPGMRPEIQIRTEIVNSASFMSESEETQFHRITFSDNGIGFDPRFAARIFNIFQRLHGKSEFEGTGIGLAICKKIAINHRGDINADGSKEGGAVFNLFLPTKKT